LATLVVAIVNVLATLIAIIFIDRWGRKPLLYAGASGMAIALFSLALDFSLPAWHAVRGQIAIASIIIYIACFAFSLGPITWLLISEIYPQRIRSRAMSIASLSNWGANFIVSLFFLSMLEAIGAPATFSIYGLMCIFTVLFVWFFVVETRRRDLESISA
jgi:MFS family permease